MFKIWTELLTAQVTECLVIYMQIGEEIKHIALDYEMVNKKDIKDILPLIRSCLDELLHCFVSKSEVKF